MKKYINQQYMKDQNLTNVLKLIQKHGRLTRRQIEASSGLSWGAVSKVTSILLELSYIKEIKSASGSAPGRTPIFLEINEKEHFSIGLDINRTGFYGVLISMKNEACFSVKKSIPVYTKENIINTIFDIINEILDLADGHNILGIGAAIQGQVDSVNGISVSFPEVDDWSNVPLASIISKKFGIPAFLEHDPECILYACSSQNSKDDMLLIRIDKGIGMAVMLNNKIFRRFGAFEIGHTTVVPDGALCTCGRAGCLEAYASINGMERVYGDSFHVLSENAKNANPKAVKAFDDMARYLALAISNTANLFNIKNILLCGEMFNYKDLFYNTFINHCDTDLKFFTADVKNASIGAAMIAADRTVLDF